MRAGLTLSGMSRLDQGFEQALELEPGETARWHAPATHREERAWVGGRIYVSDRRLFFCPGVLSRGRHETLRVVLSTITAVEVLGRDCGVLTGGLRRRVRVTTTGGERHDFSLPRFARRARELEAALQAGRLPSG